MKKGITIVDIAKKLHMSTSTVSKSLNDHPSISAMTKERVKKFAKEYNYIPNEAARHFKLSKSYTIAVIMPELLDQFYVLAINGIEEVLARHKYNVIVSQTHEDAEKELSIINSLLGSRVDGVIISVSKETKSTDKLKLLVDRGNPVILFSRSLPDNLFSRVSSDSESGALKAINFLKKRGHQRIAHIMGPKSMATSLLRLEAYKSALKENGIAFDKQLVREINFSVKSTENAIASLLKVKNPPTALFMFKNYISLDVINYLKKTNPDMINKIDIVGYGNLPLLKYLEYKPTASIDENPYEMGRQAAELILSEINKDSTTSSANISNIKVPCKLISKK